MLIYIDSDAVRMRVHRKLLVQSLPQLEVRCVEQWESGMLEGIPPARFVVVFACLDGMTESTLAVQLAAARSEHPGLRWYAMWAAGHEVPDWVGRLAPDAVLALPLDVHAIKHELKSVAK